MHVHVLSKSSTGLVARLVELCAQQDILPQRRRQYPRFLRGVREAPRTLPRPQPLTLGAEGRQFAEEGHQQRRLARADGAHQQQHLLRAHLEAHAAQRRRRGRAPLAVHPRHTQHAAAALGRLAPRLAAAAAHGCRHLCGRGGPACACARCGVAALEQATLLGQLQQAADAACGDERLRAELDAEAEELGEGELHDVEQRERDHRHLRRDLPPKRHVQREGGVPLQQRRHEEDGLVGGAQRTRAADPIQLRLA